MRDEEEQVILVDAEDREIGTAPKLAAHQAGGRLHRAFSVFVLNSREEVLLQRRAAGKYHGAGLWSNSCCGHPRPGESTPAAARRRLREEMGIDLELEELFAFSYRAEMESGLTEHEIDHVLVGRFEGPPVPDSSEVGDWRWLPLADLAIDVAADPAAYTPWLSPALAGLLNHRSGAPAPERSA